VTGFAILLALALDGGAPPAPALVPAPAADSCPTPPKHVLPGIDVSSFQGVIDWRKVKGDGIVFAFARVSDGLEVVDQSFAKNYRAMKRAGVRRGVYQHFRASVSPKKQAELLVAAIRRTGRPDLPVVADVETDDGMPPDEVRARLKKWLRLVELRTRRRPIIYTSPSMSPTLGRGFGAYHLWVAHYDVACPRAVDGWRRWSLWQRSSTGRVSGINGNVDLDTFAGTPRELRRLGLGGRPAPRAGGELAAR
jgi:lysozyme